MLELSRIVRFCLNGPGQDAAPPPRHNTYSAWPPMRGLGRYYQLEVACAGAADPRTGYFLNIKHIDDAVRTHVLPYLEQLLLRDPTGAGIPLGTLLREVAARLQPALPDAVQRVRLELTPYYSLALETRDMDHAILRQSYEFSAAHRLHVPELGAAENRRLFGKCNHPSSHGHNYRLEVAMRVPIGADGHVVPVADLDAIVDVAAIQKLDHKHLNVDVPEFAHRNPSVENITQVIFHWLSPALAAHGAKLDEVRVWETEKTVCSYRGE